MGTGPDGGVGWLVASNVLVFADDVAAEDDGGGHGQELEDDE